MITHRFDTIIGNIPGDWESAPMRRLLAFHKGGDWGADEGEVETKVLRSTNFTMEGHLDLSDVAVRYLSPRTAEILEPKKGDLLLERSGGGPTQPVGRIAFIEDDMTGYALSNFVQLLRPNDEEINPEYLGWVLHELNRSGVVERLQHQTTQMRNLDYRDYIRVLVPKPPRPEQDAIANAFRLISEAMAKAKDEIDAAFRLKKALMQQLFTRGIPGRHTRFKQTKTGEVPEEWDVVPLAIAINGKVTNGYSPLCPEEPTGHWILSLDALGFDSFNPLSIKPAPKYDEKVMNYVLSLKDILVSRSNTPERVGLAGLYMGTPPNCSYPDLMMRFRVDEEKARPKFVEEYLRTSFARRWLTARASGTSGSMVKIKRRDLKSMPAPFPHPEEQDEIIKVLDTVKSTIKTVEQNFITLQRLKTSLLQNFLTGKVRLNVKATT